MSVSPRVRLGVGLAFVIGVAGWAWTYLAPTDGPTRADPLDAAQVARGRDIYQEACASCHGKNLEGQENWRSPLPSGGLPAPPHDESGHTWHHPDEILFRITKFGGAAEAPAGFKSNMPGFADTLTDRDIDRVLAYIKSRWPEAIRLRQAEIDRRYRQQRGG